MSFREIKNTSAGQLCGSGPRSRPRPTLQQLLPGICRTRSVPMQATKGLEIQHHSDHFTSSKAPTRTTSVDGQKTSVGQQSNTRRLERLDGRSALSTWRKYRASAENNHGHRASCCSRSAMICNATRKKKTKTRLGWRPWEHLSSVLVALRGQHAAQDTLRMRREATETSDALADYRESWTQSYK